MTDTPTIRQTLRFLRTEAAEAALRTILPIGTIRQDGDTLTIAGNTPLELRVERRPTGHVIISPTHNSKFPLQRLGPGRAPSRFEILHDHIQETALHSILTELQAWLRLTPGPPDPPAEDPQHNLLKLYNSPQVRRTAQEEARRIAGLHPSLQGPGDPIDRAHALLREFLGPDFADTITHLAGDNATLFHLNIMQFHLKDFQERAKQFPNDLVLWAQTADAPPHGDVANHVQAATAHAVDKFLRHPFNSLPQDWPATLEAFRNLHPQALREFPQQDIDKLSRLCTAIKTAGVQPSPQAARHLLANPHIHGSTPPRLAPTFITESHNLQGPDDGPAQDRLLAQMSAIQRYAANHHIRLGKHRWNPRPLQSALSIWRHGETLTWQHLLDLAPPWVKNLTSQDELRQYENTLPTLRTEPRGFVYMNNVLDSHPAKDLISLRVSLAATIHNTPGDRALVFTIPTDRPFMLAQRRQDGTITFQNQRENLPHLPIPDPDNDSKYNFLYAYYDLKTLMHHTAITIIQDTLLKNWDRIRKDPTHRPLKGIGLQDTADAILRKLHTQHGDLSTDISTMSTVLARAVLQMTDTPTWETAAEAIGPGRSDIHIINAFQYNTAATLKDHIPHLLKTNPGAVALGFKYLRSAESIKHPGHFISLTRSHMEQQGLEPKAWKTAATLDHRTATAITNHCYSAKQPALILNLIARTQAAPSPTIARTLASTVVQNLDRPGVPTLNLNTIARLLCRESRRRLDNDPGDADQRHLDQQSQDVLDYVLQITRENEVLRSTTWNSLLRKSDDWHRQMRRTRTQTISLRQMQNAREESQTPPQSWNSLMPSTTTHGRRPRRPSAATASYP